MKKIIKGAVFNTGTASRLATWKNNYGETDFNYCTEDLYITKAGKYFLHGKGGAMSKYANSWGGGEAITPLSMEASMKWAEEKLTGEKYCEIFGEPEELSDTKVTLNLTVTPECKLILERMRSEQGRSISQIVVDLVMSETLQR